jgi:plasmid stability protein
MAKTTMSTLTLRDVPDELHVWLKQQAEIHHRSINKEIIVVLENARKLPPSPPAKPTVAEILAIDRECAALPVRDGRSADEILDYTENPLGLSQ